MTHHPQMGAVGKRGRPLAFTYVNVFVMSNLQEPRLRLFTWGSGRKRIWCSDVNALIWKLLRSEDEVQPT